MLILFDIDMTLIETNHIGIECLHSAGRALFRQDFTIEGIVFGGCLDPVIIAEMLTLNGIEPSRANIRSMREYYHASLGDRSRREPIARALPGALALVEGVRVHESAPALGLLTGNFPETGTLKITAAGFDPSHFTINAWGDASPHPRPVRSHLPPVAIENYAKARGAPIDPGSVLIIGDTEHDIRCAIDSGCRSLGVTTGHASRAQLEAAGADLVVDDLTGTDHILDWMMPPSPTRQPQPRSATQERNPEDRSIETSRHERS